MDQPLSREFMAAYFPNDVQLDRAPSRSQPSRENIGHELLPPPGRNLGMFGTPAPTASSSTNSNQLSFDAFGIDLGAMNVQGHSLDGQGQGHPQHAQMPHGNQQALLEQQLKLAKLRQLQLQHEILQQQIELISGQNGQTLASPVIPMDHHRAGSSSYNGLPTPAASTELRPTPSGEFVSPMALHYLDISQETMPNLPPHTPIHTQSFQVQQNSQAQHSVHPSPHLPAQMWNSAPANMVFSNPVGSDAFDLDISPITSPWFGATQPGQAGSSLGGAGVALTPGAHGNSGKRGPSPSGQEGEAARTRRRRAAQPSAVRMSTSVSAADVHAAAAAAKRSVRSTKSASSTPLLSSKRRRGSTATMLEVPNDTPSPVDLSMPPPAPPGTEDTEMTPTEMSSSPTGVSCLKPVTPASFMNLAGIGVRGGLTPTNIPADVLAAVPAINEPKTIVTRTRAATVAATSATSGAKGGRKSTTESPSTFKHILPGNASAIAPASAAQPKKITNHKESEQKRRDSLKAAYDTLRGLLPPIPLPSEDGFTAAGEPVLPGALPPRGPPRGAGDGPNRGVSKLQLLRCGNEFIKALSGRVVRRDDEIALLRRHVGRMREALGPAALTSLTEDMEALDLDKDLDEMEGPAGVGGAFLASAAAATERAEEEEFAA